MLSSAGCSCGLSVSPGPVRRIVAIFRGFSGRCPLFRRGFSGSPAGWRPSRARRERIHTGGPNLVSIDLDRLKSLSASCILAAGLLAGTLGAPAAYALPGDPGDGGGGTGGGGGPICVPDPTVTGKDAQLQGTLRLLD